MVLFQTMLQNNLFVEAEQLFACTSLLHNHRSRKFSHTLHIVRDADKCELYYTILYKFQDNWYRYPCHRRTPSKHGKVCGYYYSMAMLLMKRSMVKCLTQDLFQNLRCNYRVLRSAPGDIFLLNIRQSIRSSHILHTIPFAGNCGQQHIDLYKY